MKLGMRKLFVVIILLAVLSVGAFVYWKIGNLPADSSDKTSKIFIIRKGEAVREIGNSLKKENLIRDPVVFFLYIKKNGEDKKIQAGDYKLSPSMSLATIVKSLKSGSLDLWVTIPEGYRAEEIANVLKETLPTYDESWRSQLDANEGYLFPDTYLIPRDATVDQVITIMKNNLMSKVEPLGLSATDARLPKILTVASLIEREAITDGEKPLIAGVINNRLDLGMPLQIDATIQYAKGTPAKWWPQVFTDDYKGVASNYNTYLRPGLPPGPIANPGIEAIKAAANPQSNDYLYYIHDTSGQIHPAKTVEQHNANVEKYL